MNIIIRTDASVQIGSGHVMRCLTIAKNLREQGCHVKFWMEPLKGNLINYIKQQGFEVCIEAVVSDMYIIDHYGLGVDWEKSIRPFTKKIVVIDDLAREHDCDLLLDQNVIPCYETRYDSLVPEHCVKLLGPRYLIMRDEFLVERKRLRTRSTEVNRLLIFMGGSDPTTETIKVLTALKDLKFSHVDVVVGNSNPEKSQIELICEQRKYNFHCQIDYMAKLMQLADFMIGAGGSTLWERCYIGLPSSSTIVADNQTKGTTYAGKLGVTINLGWHEQVTVDTYVQLLGNIQMGKMSKKGLQLTANDLPNAWLHKILELIL